MRQITPDIYLMQGLRRSHVYLLASEDGLALIDSGMAGEAGQIVAQLDEAGYGLSDLRAILLTHYHGDHVGNVAELAQRSGARVLAHRDDVPYIEQTESLPPGSSVSRRLLNWMSERVFKTAPCKVDQILQDGDVVDMFGGLQVIHTPGHTPGSIVFYQPERRILFCGDVLFNQSSLQLAPSFFSLNVPQARESAQKLASLPVEMLCLGHGEPILENAGERIRLAVG